MVEDDAQELVCSGADRARIPVQNRTDTFLACRSSAVSSNSHAAVAMPHSRWQYRWKASDAACRPTGIPRDAACIPTIRSASPDAGSANSAAANQVEETTPVSSS